jgi:hypothetical protein
MKIINQYKNLLFFLFIGLLLSACDPDGEENMSWRPGSTLKIIGPDAVELKPGTAGTANYRVEGFTIKENYTWTVNGTTVTPTRNGEFISVSFPTPGDYTIEVNNGTYRGSMMVTAEVAEPE